MTDQDVIDLYRCLLGRAPEAPDTVAAFRTYFSSVDRGRRAIFDSDEFLTYFLRETGRVPQLAENLGDALAFAFLERAARATAPTEAASPCPPLRDGMAAMFARLPAARIAVVVGAHPDLRVTDLAPFARPEAAILQVAPNFPPVVPLCTVLEDGTALFRLFSDPASLAALLTGQEFRIDALYLLGAPARQEWITTLAPLISPHALVVVGAAHAGFVPAPLLRALATHLPAEPPAALMGLQVFHRGGWHLQVTYRPPAIIPPLSPHASRPKLAIAAIVRNDTFITNMLQSVLPVASFIAVLDTGSTNDTPKLTRDFLAKSGVEHIVAESTLEKFDDMRNAALDLVPDTIDWVLMLDADEELVAEDYPALFTLIENATSDAYALPRYNFPGADKSGSMIDYPDRQTRLIRRNARPTLRYTNPVHEKIDERRTGYPPLDASAIGGSRGGPHIHHLVRRFKDGPAEDAKQEHYRTLARKFGGYSPGM